MGLCFVGATGQFREKRAEPKKIARHLRMVSDLRLTFTTKDAKIRPWHTIPVILDVPHRRIVFLEYVRAMAEERLNLGTLSRDNK